MKLTIHEFLTLDGVMQGPGGAEEDRSGGFERGGWLVPHVDQDFGEIVSAWFAPAEAILLGRTTFELMRPYWKQFPDQDNPVAKALNGMPKYLVSSTVTDPDWGDTRCFRASRSRRCESSRRERAASSRSTGAGSSRARSTPPASSTSTGC